MCKPGQFLVQTLKPAKGRSRTVPWRLLGFNSSLFCFRVPRARRPRLRKSIDIQARDRKTNELFPKYNNRRQNGRGSGQDAMPRADRGGDNKLLLLDPPALFLIGLCVRTSPHSVLECYVSLHTNRRSLSVKICVILCSHAAMSECLTALNLELHAIMYPCIMLCVHCVHACAYDFLRWC